MTRTRGALVATLISLTVLALAGCTGAGEEPPQGGDGKEAAAPAPAADAEQTTGASITTASLAEQTFDATSGNYEETPGGTITMTLRSVEVTGETMTVRWALRWDNPDKGDDATTSFLSLGTHPTPTVTDGMNLKVYKPFCTQGSWTGTALERQACEISALTSPTRTGSPHLTNHATVEAWALLPAPQGEPGPLDVLPVEAWPSFGGVTPVIVDDGK